LDDPNGKKQLIKETNSKFQIVELFVRDIEVYLEKARAFFKDKETEGKI
jgi:ubiquitin carboxyl-terminal hydrolase 9/24